MALAMKKFDKYWDMCDKIFAMVTFPDPRYKMLAITYYFDLIYGDSGVMPANDISNIIKKLYQEYASKD